MRKKIGRPKKLGPKLDTRIVFMTTKAESRDFHKAARERRISLAEAGREAINDYVKKVGPK